MLQMEGRRMKRQESGTVESVMSDTGDSVPEYIQEERCTVCSALRGPAACGTHQGVTVGDSGGADSIKQNTWPSPSTCGSFEARKP